MTEEFFIAFGDEPEPRPAAPPGRRTRAAQAPQDAAATAPMLAVMLTLFLLGGAGAGLYLGYDKVKG